MASSLLPPATFAKKYPALLHPHIYSARPHVHKLIKCGASPTDGGAAVPDELLGVPPNQVAPVVGDTTNDGWAAFLDELKGAMQADPSSPAAGDQANAGAAIPGELLSAPPVSDATNAGAAVVPDELLMSADPSSPVAGYATTNGGAAVIPDELLSALHLDASNPVVRGAGGALSRLHELTAGMTDAERWALFGFLAVTWLYLTARPGVLSGAVDTYVLAPLQLALDSVLGRRSLKMSDFVVGERIGEGSFGVVYSGAVVPRNGVVEERVGKAKMRLDLDDRYKEKVILKKVRSVRSRCIELRSKLVLITGKMADLTCVFLFQIKVGTFGAKECGDYEEWFNYRVARAAPESCAEFLGSFVADKTKSEFVMGGKWLVWKFEVCMTTAIDSNGYPN